MLDSTDVYGKEEVVVLMKSGLKRCFIKTQFQVVNYKIQVWQVEMIVTVSYAPAMLEKRKLGIHFEDIKEWQEIPTFAIESNVSLHIHLKYLSVETHQDQLEYVAITEWVSSRMVEAKWISGKI